MVNTLFSGGPFMMVLLILAGSILFISVKNINQPYKTNGIVMMGILSALIGILATYLGVNAAFTAVPDISNIAPQILINGLKTSLITSLPEELSCLYPRLYGTILLSVIICL